MRAQGQTFPWKANKWPAIEKSPEAAPAEEVAERFGSLVDAGDVASISQTQHLM
jgi:hypothetical protein